MSKLTDPGLPVDKGNVCATCGQGPETRENTQDRFDAWDETYCYTCGATLPKTAIAGAEPKSPLAA